MKVFFIASFNDYEKIIDHYQQILDFIEYEYNKSDVELIFPYNFLYPKEALEQGQRLNIRIAGENAVVSYDDSERTKEYIVENNLRAIREKVAEIGSDYQRHLSQKLASDLEIMSWCDAVCTLSQSDSNVLERVVLSLEQEEAKDLGLSTILVPRFIISDHQKSL